MQRCRKYLCAAKNVAKIGGKALGLAAIPLEVANMLNMRKQGKTTAEILGSPFFLSGRIGEARFCIPKHEKTYNYKQTHI